MEETSVRGGFRDRRLFLTFTYKPGVDWEACHIRDLMQRLRVWHRRRRIPARYVWTLELTQAGRVHYHAVVWIPRHLHLPKADKRGWWRHGSTKTETARNPVGYLAKYASKGTRGKHRVPRSARICGGGGLDPCARVTLRWWMTPRWFRERVPSITDVRRVPGGYVETSTGELHESPWRFIGFDAGFTQLLFEPRNLT